MTWLSLSSTPFNNLQLHSTTLTPFNIQHPSSLNIQQTLTFNHQQLSTPFKLHISIKPRHLQPKPHHLTYYSWSNPKNIILYDCLCNNHEISFNAKLVASNAYHNFIISQNTSIAILHSRLTHNINNTFCIAMSLPSIHRLTPVEAAPAGKLPQRNNLGSLQMKWR